MVNGIKVYIVYNIFGSALWPPVAGPNSSYIPRHLLPSILVIKVILLQLGQISEAILLRLSYQPVSSCFHESLEYSISSSISRPDLF